MPISSSSSSNASHLLCTDLRISKHLYSFVPELADYPNENISSHINDAVNYITDEGEKRFETSHHHTSTSSLGQMMINTRIGDEENQPLIGFESEQDSKDI